MPHATGVITGLGRVRLTLEPTAQPSESGGAILATGFLADERGGHGIEGETIVFWLGAEEAAVYQTDSYGRASWTFGGLGFTTHAISVQCAGIHVTYRHTFERKARKLARPNFRAEGDEGDYIIAGSLTYEDGKPASGIRVRFLISALGTKPREEHDVSDADGFVRYGLTFEEAECDVTVQVREFEQKIENLYGRSRTPKPRRYQRPDDAELRQGSFGDVIRRAWQRGGKDAKGETP